MGLNRLLALAWPLLLRMRGEGRGAARTGDGSEVECARATVSWWGNVGWTI